MTILSYKGYQGQVSYEKGFLLIEVMHVDDSVMCECRDLNDVQAAFEDLVDDYIETCAAIGKEPQKPFKGSFNVRVGPDLHRKAAMAATCERETLNSWVVCAIQERLDEVDRRRSAAPLAYEFMRAMRAEQSVYEASKATNTPKWMRLVEAHVSEGSNYVHASTISHEKYVRRVN